MESESDGPTFQEHVDTTYGDTDNTEVGVDVPVEASVDGSTGAPIAVAEDSAASTFTTVEQGNTSVVATEVARPGVIFSGQEQDTVLLSHCIYKNVYSRKSLTVHHLQRRLNELGFLDAINDVDGFFGDLTLHSVQEFQHSRNLNVTTQMTEETFLAIFLGDPHVLVVI